MRIHPLDLAIVVAYLLAVTALGMRFRRGQHNADDLFAVAAALNSRPRNTFGWKTPAETLNDHLLSLQQASVATTP